MATKIPDTDLLLNPNLNFDISCRVRRTGQPITTVKLRSAEDLALLASVLRLHGLDAPNAATHELGQKLGIFLREGEALPTDMTSFRCDLSEDLLPLVPPEHRIDPNLPLDKSALVLNENIHVQTGDELPAAIAGRIPPGKELWSRLDGYLPDGPHALDPERPIVWVERPETRILQPFWLSGTWGNDLRKLVIEKVSPTALSDEAVRALMLADVLLPRDHFEALESTRKSTAEVLRQQLIQRKYAVLRDIVSPLFTANLRRHARALRQSGYFVTDKAQVVGMRDGMYCELMSMFLQHQLTGFLNQITDAPIKPSYTWIMRYRPGADLERHIDRPQCRWNVSFCIDTEPDVERENGWPLYMEINHGRREARLGMGDALLYSGSEVFHWREPLPAEQSATICFFHYVPASFLGSLR